MDLTAIEATLKAAVGKPRSREDYVSPAVVERLAVTLESPLPAPRSGEFLPAGWHTVFCLQAPPRAALGPDGMPATFDQIPAVPMQRRMFGGARLTFHAPLVVGQPISCESELIDAKVRTSAAGHMAIATLRHRYFGATGLAVAEEQDIIFLEPIAGSAEKSANAPEPKPAPTWTRRIDADPILLFRFSALTFNSHRIHYDAPYSAAAEKLPGLIVQGKLIALHLLENVRAAAPGARLTRLDYRSGRPLFAGAPFSLSASLDAAGTAAKLWADDDNGRTVQTASVEFAEPVRV